MNQASRIEQDCNRGLSVFGILPGKRLFFSLGDIKDHKSQGSQATTDKEHGLTRNGYSVTSRQQRNERDCKLKVKAGSALISKYHGSIF